MKKVADVPDQPGTDDTASQPEDRPGGLALTLVGIRLLLLNVTYFFLPLYLKSIGVSGWMTGVLLATFAVTALLSAFQTGVVTDRYRIGVMVAVGFLLMAVFNLLLMHTREPVILLAVFFVGGLGNNILEISLVSFILKKTGRRGAGGSFGLYFTVTGTSIGVGVLVGGQLLSSIGYSLVFGLSAAAFLVASVAALFLTRTPVVRSSMSRYAGDIKTGTVALLTAGFWLVSLHWGAEITSLTPFLRDAHMLDEGDTGLYLSAAIIGLAASAWLGGRAFDHGIPITRILVTGLVLSGAGHIFMTMVPLLPSWLIRLTHEFGDGLTIVSLFILVHRIFPRERIGGLASFVATATILGRLIGTLVFAPLGETFGHEWSLIISGLLVFVAIIPLMPVLRTIESSRGTQSTERCMLKTRED